ncbi:MAG: hypothetical protein V1725_06230 [archaeon]
MPTHLLKKGQLQMLESIGVIIIITFLIFFSFSIYQRFHASEIARKNQQQNQLSAIDVANRIGELPELQCSHVDVVTVGCFDLVKVQTFAAFATSPAFRLMYYPLLRESSITVYETYPSPHNFTIYEQNATNTSIPFFMPITIYHPQERTYGFGYIEVLKE